MRLFKYLHPDRTAVLENQSIRFTQPQYLNDPFEQLPFVSSFTTPERFDVIVQALVDRLSQDSEPITIADADIEKFSRYLAIFGLEEVQAAFIIRQLISISPTEGLSFLTNPDNLSEFKKAFSTEQGATMLPQQLKEKLGMAFGLLCLTQSNDNIPMWSHYANNGEGFVIEFDPTNQFFANDSYELRTFRKLQRVRYPKPRPNLVLFDNLKQLEKDLAKAFFFTKSYQWKYEKEVRLMRFLEEASTPNDPYYLFSFEPSAILNVYLGINVKPKCEAEIVAILNHERYAHVELFKAALNPREYTLDFERYHPV